MNRDSAAVTAVLGAVLAFYVWTAATSWRGVAFRRDTGVPGTREFAGYHNLLGDAFLAGQLHLLIQPRPELLALPDPYDPRQNAPFRLHDASLYHAKYYLYWGPAPVLLLFLPFRVLTGLCFPESLAAALFCFGGAAFSAAVLLRVQQRFFPATPRWMTLLAVASLGLANTAPALLRRPAVYETSLASAYCLAFAAVYCFVRTALDDAPRARWLLAGSLLLGLAVAARPPYLFAALVPAALAPSLFRAGPGRPRQLACLVAPFVLCVGLLGLYNRLRFDSWTDFGYRYTLTGREQMTRYPEFDAARIPPGLFAFFLQPPGLGVEFPFWRMERPRFERLPQQYYPDVTVGLLPAVPLLAIWFLLPAVSGDLRRIVAGFGAFGAAVALFVSAVTAPSIMYQLYFAGPLLLGACLLWLGLSPRWAWLPTWGLVVGVLSSFTGVDDSLRRYHSDTYRQVASAFVPIERLAVKIFGAEYGPVILRVQFDDAPAGTGAPLVVTGFAGAGDFAFVRYESPETIVFGLDHWGAPPILSRAVPIRPGETYEIEVDMGSLHRARDSRTLFLVKLNGQEVLRAQSEFYRAAPDQVTIGRNDIGGACCGPRFTGQILDARRAPGW